MIRIEFDDEDLATLRRLTNEAVGTLHRQVADNAKRNKVFLVVGYDGQMRCYGYKTSVSHYELLLIELTYSSRQGLRMFYHNELAKPGTAVWEAVASVTGATVE